MRILVTGGAGFVGSHLCDRLVQQGHQVTALDNLRTGSRLNVAHLKDNRLFEFVEADVQQALHGDYDRIYNLACPASPPHYQADPIYTSMTCISGALNVLDLAHRNDCRVLQASTSEVYGDPDISPQPESYRGSVNPHGIRACYDEGKRMAESLFFDHHRMHGTRIKVARIFNTYGPRMDPNDGRVVSNFIVQALQGRSLTLYGDGSQTRSFCYVDDMVEGLMRLMESDEDVLGPINLGNEGEFSMLELASQVLELTRSRASTEFLPLPQDDPRQRRPDLTLARTRLGWEPTVALRDGLRRTIDYFAARLAKAA